MEPREKENSSRSRKALGLPGRKEWKRVFSEEDSVSCQGPNREEDTPRGETERLRVSSGPLSRREFKGEEGGEETLKTDLERSKNGCRVEGESN